jgi:hypothetical protein
MALVLAEMSRRRSSDRRCRKTIGSRSHCNERRALSLMVALFVNSGTDKGRPSLYTYDVPDVRASASRPNDGLPVGQIIFVIPKNIAFVQPFNQKYSSSVFRKISAMIRSSRLGKRGERVVTIVGRDAMDVGDVARRAAKRADGEGVWAWRLAAGAKLAPLATSALRARRAVKRKRR